MSAKLQRMLEKAQAIRRNRPDTILIDCPRPEDVPARVDTLIAAGKFAEADRPRCMFWPNSHLDQWDGTEYEWALMIEKNMTPDDIQRLLDEFMLTDFKDMTRDELQCLWNGMIEDARATVLAAANSDDNGSVKKRKPRFPVNRL